MNQYSLYLLDVDGIADRDSDTPYSDVAPALDALPGLPTVALITNQSGVGLRGWMEAGGFGEPEKCPDIHQVRRRLIRLSGALIVAGVYVSLAYQAKTSGKWWPEPKEAMQLDAQAIDRETRDPELKYIKERWAYGWRKPNPGMIHKAMRDFGVGDGQVLVVGDRDEDEAAAWAAGVDFMRADEFFGRGDAQNY